ncbi:hypothetical protein D3C80_2164040 [compost metagenome]
MLTIAIKRKWLTQDLDSRALALTATGRKEISRRFAIELPVQLPTMPRTSTETKRRTIASPAP